MRIALLTGLLFFLGACGGSPVPSGALDELPGPIDPGQPDAGTPPQEDAGLPPDAGQPDAGQPDAGSPDAGQPDAGTPPDAGSPDAGPVGRPGPSPSKPAWSPLQDSIPVYELTLTKADYDALFDNIRDRKFKVEGTFTHEGGSHQVQLRFRGRSTRTDPRIVKKSWQVRFDKQDRFEGKSRIELLAAWKDSGYLTEKLWYDLGASVGLRMSRARYVHLKINVRDGGSVVTRYEGVFTELESVKKDFLRKHGFDDDGDIYRCGMHDCEMRPLSPDPSRPEEPYMEPWEKQTNEDQPWDRLRTFLDGVNRTPPHRFPAFLEQSLNLEDYLTWMVLETLIANDIQGDSRSYLVYDREMGNWTYVPWDLNNAVSLYNRTNPVIQGVKEEHPLFTYTAYDESVYELFLERRDKLLIQGMKPTYSTLSTRIMDDPGLRARYVARLRHLLESWFTEENLGPRIDAMFALLAPHVQRDGQSPLRDPYVSHDHAALSAWELREFVRERRKWLLEHLHVIESLGDGPLVIDRVGRDASGAFWVQLYNRGTTPVSLEGRYLSGFTRVPDQWRLPSLRVEPGQVVTFHQSGSGTQRLGATMNPERPEVSLYEADGLKAVDLLWLAPLAPGEAYGRQPRGAESFGPQSGP